MKQLKVLGATNELEAKSLRPLFPKKKAPLQALDFTSDSFSTYFYTYKFLITLYEYEQLRQRSHCSWGVAHIFSIHHMWSRLVC